jgi:hypothetical protein
VYAGGPQMMATVLSVPVEGRRKPVLLVEIQGSELGIAKKTIQKETVVEPAPVNGGDGLWIRGPHVVAFIEGPSGINSAVTRQSGSALVWQRGSLTLRLEGNLTREQALRLARTIN